MYTPQLDYTLKRSVLKGFICFDIDQVSLTFSDAGILCGLQCNHVEGSKEYTEIEDLCKQAVGIFKKIDSLNNAIEAKRFVGSNMGLYDEQDPNQASIKADKVIDVTGLCPNSPQCIIKYATITNGRIAQLNNFYRHGEDMGMSVHYFLNKLTPELLAKDEVFERQVKYMGASPVQLANVIFNHQ